MPNVSQYCYDHPNDEECFYGDGTYNGDGTWGNNGGGIFNPNNVPNGVGNAGGWPGGSSGQLAQILNSILASTALLTNAHYIPTPLQTGQSPQGSQGNQPQITNVYPNAANPGGGNNTLGKIESWIKQNTGVTAIFVGGALLYFMKPKQRSLGR